MPIRALLVAPSLRIVGGQSIQAKRLLEALTQAPDLDANFQATNAELPAFLASCRRVKYLRTVVTEAVYSVQLLKAIRAVDVVHVFVAAYSSFFLTLAPVLAAARLTGRPVILHHHDGRAGDHFRQSRVARWLARQATRIVVPSQYLVDVFSRRGLQATAIANIIDCSAFIYRQRATVAPKFLHNRGLERHYNPECSLRAFAIVQHRYPDASIDIAHDGPLRGRLEALATELSLRNARFVGSVGDDQMRALYDIADIYLMSPDVDNMPLSVLECFASGLPVVSTAAGGVPYLVEDGKNGLLAPLNDYEALAAASFRLIEEPSLAKTIADNALHECARYKPASIAGQWANLYRETIARR